MPRLTSRDRAAPGTSGQPCVLAKEAAAHQTTGPHTPGFHPSATSHSSSRSWRGRALTSGSTACSRSRSPLKLATNASILDAAANRRATAKAMPSISAAAIRNRSPAPDRGSRRLARSDRELGLAFHKPASATSRSRSSQQPAGTGCLGDPRRAPGPSRRGSARTEGSPRLCQEHAGPAGASTRIAARSRPSGARLAVQLRCAAKPWHSAASSP
jgi:hypothetical protein